MLLPLLCSASLLAAVEPHSMANATSPIPSLKPSHVVADGDGTWRHASGFRWKGPSGSADQVASAFLSTHGSALGVPKALLVDQVLRVGTVQTVRLFPRVQGIPVLGADVTVVVDGTGAVTEVSRGHRFTGSAPRFLLTARDAALVALAHGPVGMPASLVDGDLAPRAFYQVGADGRLRPVYAVVVPSAVPVWSVKVLVDAEHGGLLSRQPLAVLEVPTAAKVYDPAPPATGTGTLVDVNLSQLKDPPPNGPHLTGHFVETFNCCKRHECLDGDGGCQQQRCLSVHDQGGVESRTNLVVPTSMFPIPPELSAFCPVMQQTAIFVDSVACSELPRATSADGDWIFTPVDLASPLSSALDSEEDEFAEVMGYYHVQKFLDHVRAVMGNAKFCLNSHACDADGNPTKPFHVAVNSLLPALDEQSTMDLVCQLCAIPNVCPAGSGGRGTQDNPARLDRYMRLANAAFVPAMDPSSNPLPIGGDAFLRPFDSLMLFQGTTRDLGYDGDVIYHETTHAVIHTLVKNGGQPAGLNGFLFDAWGVHNQAGALNEGYADFFSASLTGNPVLGEYTNADMEEGLVRDSSVRATCPNDLTGEVHDDSRPWANALWSLRQALAGTDPAKITQFETAVWAALATLNADASFADAAQATATTLSAAFPGANDKINEVLGDRGMSDCQRARALVRQVNGVPETVSIPTMYVSGTTETGLTNYVPGPLQWKLELPDRTRSFTLRFSLAMGTSMIPTGTTEDRVMRLALKRDQPIAYSYTSNATSHDAVDNTITASQTGEVTFTFDANEMNGASVYYVSFNLEAPSGVQLKDITAELDVLPAPDAGVVQPDAGSTASSGTAPSGDDDDDDSAGPACQCSSGVRVDWPVGLLLLLGAATLRRRR